MSRRLRDNRPIKGQPIEKVFADFEAMEPIEGDRHTRKPAKSTLRSAGTKSQLGAAVRQRKTAKPTNTRTKKKAGQTAGKPARS
jgi:hypothetical protein